jgi:hypothetical protein
MKLELITDEASWLTVCSAILCKYLSCLDRWLIQERMKFFVNNIGMLSSFTRFNAFWKTWKPQYLRCGDDVEENNDSIK